MTAKSAKKEFTKSDIIEILKKNVDLYKDEPEFVDYIVNLALYLIDHAYCSSGVRPSDLDAVLESISGMNRKNGVNGQSQVAQSSPEAHQAPPPNQTSEDVTEGFKSEARESGSLTNLLEQENESLDESGILDSQIESIDDEDDDDDDDGPKLGGFDELLKIQNQKRKSLQDSQFEPVMKAPTMGEKSEQEEEPESDVDYHEPKTDRLNANEIEEIQRQTRDESLTLKTENKPLLDIPVKQYRSSGQPKPKPSDGLSDKLSSPDLDEEEPSTKQLGRAQVYKVVRTYKQKKDAPNRCPSCNAYTRGRSICPSCGHIL